MLLKCLKNNIKSPFNLCQRQEVMSNCNHPFSLHFLYDIIFILLRNAPYAIHKWWTIGSVLERFLSPQLLGVVDLIFKTERDNSQSNQHDPIFLNPSVLLIHFITYTLSWTYRGPTWPIFTK